MTRRPAAGAAAGFTFIELMVVIAILALMASIVVVNLDGMSAPTQLRGAARAFGGEVAYLKETAALRGHTFVLEIELDKKPQHYRVIEQPSETDIPDVRERADAAVPDPWVDLPDGVSMSADPDAPRRVEFSGDGEIFPSGFVMFFTHERLREDRGVSVEVSGLTGLVSYHDGPFKAEEVRRPEDF